MKNGLNSPGNILCAPPSFNPPLPTSKNAPIMISKGYHTYMALDEYLLP